MQTGRQAPPASVQCLHSSLRITPRQRTLRLHRRLSLSTSAAKSSNSGNQYNLFLDCDGVLVDTEAQGHRVSFNKAFKQKGLDFSWSEDEYGHLLAIGGGKERMTHYFTEHNYIEPFRSMTSMEDRKAYVKDMHLLKTDLFMKLIEEGQLPLRPGVKRLIDEAIEAGAQVAICSTSNEKAVQKIVDVMLSEEASKIKVFAGDIVHNKKPDPAIYLLAAKELGVEPSSCVVVEDSHIGLKAAKAAGMRCVVTKSSYTEEEDFSKADAVFDCIGDKGDERFTFADMIGDKFVH